MLGAQSAKLVTGVAMGMGRRDPTGTVKFLCNGEPQARPYIGCLHS